MENNQPELMTREEEQHAARLPDASLFQAGFPSLISAAIERTWAEPYILLRNLAGKQAEKRRKPDQQPPQLLRADLDSAQERGEVPGRGVAVRWVSRHES